jgi:hypothetical protein
LVLIPVAYDFHFLLATYISLILACVCLFLLFFTKIQPPLNIKFCDLPDFRCHKGRFSAFLESFGCVGFSVYRPPDCQSWYKKASCVSSFFSYTG